MTDTYHLIDAKMSMKAKKERQRKKENDEMASYREPLLCVPFLRVPFSSQVMS